jgi:hypothetical protein
MSVLAFILAAAEEGSEPSKAPFYVLGGVLAAWAVVVSAIGITQPDFPQNQGRARLVYAISALLVLGAVGSAVLTS